MSLTPAKVTPDDIKKHLAEKHQFEADNSLSLKELEDLHRRLHEDEEKPKTTLV